VGVPALLAAASEGVLAVTGPVWALGFAQRHLAVAAEGEDRAPQALPVLRVEAIQLVIGLHAHHRIPPLTLPGG
jgi:hypothetical protein